ncbi:PRC-barrel domain-containing protein [uncultured Mucilaginibacter sp.]|uniref:PRC-barrel domain-containing protein n=1 Tax=uncultured Mucilaginibacter sp. TaxID=797541 RepID=UPI0025FF4FE6|nr:PRC-barrel domain-containing protein [uncultured Mucilaginibacter sp.]
MKRNVNSLIGFSVAATDGEIGEVEDFHFDDETWTIRYLIVKTGSWLSERKVLISREALLKDSFAASIFHVNMTMEQVQNSPDIDTDKPVSRQQEAKLNSHHFWGIYWEGGNYAGGMGVGNPPHVTPKESDKTGEDFHLRSAKEVSGYRIHALDGEIGHVNNFIVDDENWQLLNFVVDTHNIIGGKKVLISVKDVRFISFTNWEVFVNLPIADVEGCELFEESKYE